MHASARRVALRVQYDGAAFAGSQQQAGVPTVQAALQAAVEALTQQQVCVELAGRTDAGVHALAQVAALTAAADLTPERWVQGLNHFLPAPVAVQAACEVPLDFDPRRAARERTYSFLLRLAGQRLPLWQRQAWVVPGPLDLAAMQDALRRLPGTRDFASFAAKPSRPGTVRTLREATVQTEAGGLRFRFRAESFLPRQVRLTVGQVVAIGQGRAEPALIDRLLAEPRCGSARPSAPPHGLYLVRVRYDLPELEQWEANDENLFGTPG